MDYANPQALVEAAWLSENLDDPTVKVIDASWFLPGVDRSGPAEFKERHIPGAVYFDIDDIADTSVPLPHMLPSAEVFAQKVGALGISSSDKVICYDVHGGFCAAMRAWWTFRVFGHDNVAVLNGGLPKWLERGHPLESGEASPEAVAYTPPQKNTQMVRSIVQMRANMESKSEQVVDARNEGRFHGLEPEPRPNGKPGHIPGSLNLPFVALLNDNDCFTLRSADEISEILEEDGIDPNKPIIASCGSGVTACVPVFALFLLGFEDVAVYDGSWAEWGERDDTPIET